MACDERVILWCKAVWKIEGIEGHIVAQIHLAVNLPASGSSIPPAQPALGRPSFIFCGALGWCHWRPAIEPWVWVNGLHLRGEVWSDVLPIAILVSSFFFFFFFLFLLLGWSW